MSDFWLDFWFYALSLGGPAIIILLLYIDIRRERKRDAVLTRKFLAEKKAAELLLSARGGVAVVGVAGADRDVIARLVAEVNLARARDLLFGVFE